MSVALPRVQRVAALALASRALCVAWIILADALLPDHDASGVRRFAFDEAPALPVWLIRPFTRWDAAHLLGVARAGYAAERDAAFFPAYPAACAVGGAAVGRVFPSLGAGERLIVAGVVASNFAFVLAAVGAYAASGALLRDEAAGYRAAAAFCATPAAVFGSACYGESLFGACAFGGLALLARGRPNAAAAAWVLAAATRSNGCLYAAVALCAGLLAAAGADAPMKAAVAAVARSAPIAAVPLLKDYAHYRRRCPGPGWCAGAAPLGFPSLYAHVQRSEWGVAPFSYWRIEQAPNFALAAPAVALAATAFYREARRLRLAASAKRFRRDALAGDAAARAALLRFALCGHALGTALLCVFVAHVEIATRLLGFGCLPVYWVLADVEADASRPGRRRLARCYVAAYAVLGTAAHANFLPWT